MWNPTVPEGWGPRNSSLRNWASEGTGKLLAGLSQMKTGPGVKFGHRPESPFESGFLSLQRQTGRRGVGVAVHGGDEDRPRGFGRVGYLAVGASPQSRPETGFEQQFLDFGPAQGAGVSSGKGAEADAIGAAAQLGGIQLNDQRLEGSPLSPVNGRYLARARGGVSDPRRFSCPRTGPGLDEPHLQPAPAWLGSCLGSRPPARPPAAPVTPSQSGARAPRRLEDPDLWCSCEPCDLWTESPVCLTRHPGHSTGLRQWKTSYRNQLIGTVAPRTVGPPLLVDARREDSATTVTAAVALIKDFNIRV